MGVQPVARTQTPPLQTPEGLDRFSEKAGKRPSESSTDGAHPGRSDRAAKAGSFRRASGRGPGSEAETAWRGSDRTVPFPRRPLAEPGDQPEKSVELSGGVPPRWRRDGVGDAGGRSELPSRSGVAAQRDPARGQTRGRGAEDLDGAEASAAVRADRRRSSGAANR